MLYLVAIVRHPSKTDADAGKSTVIVAQPIAIWAKDQNTASAQACIQASVTDMTNIEVIARPFS